MDSPSQTISKPLSIAKAGDACFADLQNLIGQNPNSEIPDETLASLHMLYGKNFTKALEVVDNGGIMCFVGERTGRTLYKVPGRRPADQYLVFPAHFCSCQSFQFDVVGRSEAVCVSTFVPDGPAGDDDDYDIPKWFKRGGAALSMASPAYQG
ncbi:hypothetical protein VaNZ11_011590 [Volvox africanus]|uniref:Uncharacterized protein n=1 Tax=Volvox africanus TaxID=51714 RepID=A0ABQ5SE04_9CHLO|nr:hypothetical protein VaNZ11_011590 [Volvox africanus]